MSSEKEIILKVDHKSRIGIDDVINMLEGLKKESIFEVIKTSGKNKFTNKDNLRDSSHYKNISEKSKSVTGNIELPQIRELNEIASLLRSMNTETN